MVKHCIKSIKIRWLNTSGVSLAGEERMRHICRHIVGDNLKGEMALFSFPHTSGGEELRGAPLVYIPDCQGPRLAMMSALPRESYPDRYHLTGGVDKLLNRSGPTFQNIPHCVLMRTIPCVA